MSVTIEAEDLKRFLDGAADVSAGPLGGIMPHRIKAEYRGQIADPLFLWNEFCPVGVHVNLRISAPTTVTLASYVLEPGDYRMSVTANAGQDVNVEDLELTNPGRLIPNFSDGTFSLQPGVPMHVHLEPAASAGGTFSILLSHTCLTELLGIESEGDVETVPVVPGRLRWVHYGSSISHGSQVVSPSRRWPEQVARKLSLHLKDFSLSGNAQMDPCMARAIAGTPADLITCAIGINIVNADSMRERFFVPALHGFLDTIREKQPNTPLYLVTACACPMQERTPGPIVMTGDGNFLVAKREVENDAGALSLERTRELIAQVAERRNDANLTVVDGRAFLGEGDAELLVDNLHPGPEGIDLMTQRISKMLTPVLSSLTPNTDTRRQRRTERIRKED